MEMKVVSGVIVTESRNGTARIGLTPHRLISGSCHLADEKTLGPDYSYRGTPAVIVALREFSFRIQRSWDDHLDKLRVKINDEISSNELKITWKGQRVHDTDTLSSASIDEIHMKEISYMVIGEV